MRAFILLLVAPVFACQPNSTRNNQATHKATADSAIEPTPLENTPDSQKPPSADPAQPTAVSAGKQSESAEVQANSDDSFPGYDNESIGGIKLGTPRSQVIAQLGQPKKRDRIGFEQATALYTQTWEYPQHGLILKMDSETRKGKQTVAAIELNAGGTASHFTTAKGVGIGSSLADVVAAYGKYRDPESDPQDTEQFIAGTVYSGLIFSLAGGKVNAIFMGAGAE